MLTIVIPTKNRSFFINRALKYYAEVLCPFPIVIGDSSDGVHLQRNRRIIDEVGSRLKISHIVDYTSHENKNLVGWQKDKFLHGLIGHVHTPYIAFYADDDFAVVNNLKSAIDFLESNKDYSFVCGEAILFSLKSGIAHGEIDMTSRYRQRDLMHDNASQRLFDLFSNYTVFEYGVSRTEQKKYRWNKVFESRVDNLVGEIINCSLVVIQGKVKKMDRLFLVRQGHSSQTSKSSQDAFDWIGKAVFPNYYAKLRDILVYELVSLDQGITISQAEEIVKKCLWLYIAKGLMNKWNIKYANHNTPFYCLKKNLGRLRSIYRGYQNIRSFMPSGRMLLPAILRSSSPYHQDFKPIYDIVTNSILES